MRKSGLYDTIFWVALGMFVCVYAYMKLGIGKFNAPGSGLMPFLLGLLFSLLALYKLVTRILRHGKSEEGTEEEKEAEQQGTVYKKVILVVVAMFAYALLLEPLGFLLITFLWMGFVCKGLGKMGWEVTILIAIITTFSSYLLFQHYLGVRFPRGFFGF